MTDPVGRPLEGRRVLVTRARAQATELAALLTERGAKPIVLPLIAPVPLTDTREADVCVERLAGGAYQWLIFSSANGVRYFLQRIRALGYGASICRRARIVAGPATVQLLAEQGIEVDLVLKRFRAETVLAALATEPLSRARVVLPRAAGGRELLAAGLRQRGARVDEVALYRTVPVPESAAVLVDWLGRGALDALTFTSGSTVRHFVAALPATTLLDLAQGDTPIACLGPVTARTACDLGLRVDAVAAQTTMVALVDALEAVYTHRSLEQGALALARGPAAAMMRI